MNPRMKERHIFYSNHSPITIVDAVHHAIHESGEAVLQNGTLEVGEG